MSKETVSAGARKDPQVIKGVVVSDAQDKTRIIAVQRRIKHKLYLKGLTRKTKIAIHDEKNVSKVGDVVTAIQTRPISKRKNFKLKAVVEQGN